MTSSPTASPGAGSRGPSRATPGPIAGCCYTKRREAPRRSGCCLSTLLELADVAHQAVVEQVDDDPHPPRVADPFVRQEPHLAPVIGARREATNQVRLGVGDDARQHAQAEA